MPLELDAASQARLVRALRASLGGAQCTLIETHISYVLVAGGEALKLRKVVDLGFLDFTTLAARRHDCDEEVRLNRRLAPSMYLGVVAVTGTVDAPAIDGAGPVLDHAVRMRAFAQDDLWNRRAERGAIAPAQVDALAVLLADFHRDAAVAPADGRLGSPAQLRAVVRDNMTALAAMLGEDAGRARLAALEAWEARRFSELEPVFARRLREGRVRECHGDLHLGNITELDGRTTVFDCIEFNDEFRWIDVMSELAFVAMDLQWHRLPALAHRLVDAYLEAGGDYDGLRVLRYYAVHRALVRAKVAAIEAAQRGGAAGAATGQAVGGHVALALTIAEPPPPTLAITHGLSGSGKTTGTQAVVEAGAVRIRADVERKRLHGLAASERSAAAPGTALYGAEATRATYERLLALAEAALEGGTSVVLDATFLQRRQRDAARALAARRGVAFSILHFDADLETLRRRVRERAARADDASDAGEAVLEWQVRHAEPLGDDERAFVTDVANAAGG